MNSYVKQPIILVAISSAVILYLGSLLMPALECRNSWSGFELLLSGWIGLIFLDPRWLANVFFIAMLLQLFVSDSPTRITLILPALATILVVACVVWKSPAGCGGSAGAPRGGPIGIGGYTWVLSILVLSITHARAIFAADRVE